MTDREQSPIFLLRHGRMRARETRARARGELQSHEKRGRTPTSPPVLPLIGIIFTSSLAARGSEERRATARGLSQCLANV